MLLVHLDESVGKNNAHNITILQKTVQKIIAEDNFDVFTNEIFFANFRLCKV